MTFSVIPPAIGNIIAGLATGALLFGGPAGELAQSTELNISDIAGSKNVRMGGPTTFAARLTLKGDDNTGNIMQWYDASKSVLMSCNGFSVSNLSIPFHINLAGTTQGLRVADGGDPATPSFDLSSTVASRSGPVAQFTLGLTPAATADFLRFVNGAGTTVGHFDRLGNLGLGAALGSANPFSLLANTASDISDTSSSFPTGVSANGIDWQNSAAADGWVVAIQNNATGTSTSRRNGLFVRINSDDATSDVANFCRNGSSLLRVSAFGIGIGKDSGGGTDRVSVSLANLPDSFRGVFIGGNSLGAQTSLATDLNIMSNFSRTVGDQIKTTHTLTGGTNADSFDHLKVERITSVSGGTQTASGSVEHIKNTNTVTGGTLADTTNVLTLTQDALSTGKILSCNLGATEHFSVDGDGLPGLPTSDTQATVGAAGSAAMLPVLPSGYIKFKIAGVTQTIPYYAAS